MAITETVAQGAHSNNIGYGSTRDAFLSMSANISFQSSYKYSHWDNDQYDINKLIGFTGANIAFNIRSARWGWRWDLTTSMVEIAPYQHISDFTFKFSVDSSTS